MLPLVDAAQRIERAGAQPRNLAHLVEQSLRAVEESRAQVILREREQRLLAMFGRQRIARQKILMDADGALDFAAPAVQRAEREVGLDGVGIRVHELQEHVERPIGLLGDEIVESGEIIRMQFAEGRAASACPSRSDRRGCR